MRVRTKVAFASAAVLGISAALLPFRTRVNLATDALLLMLGVAFCALKLGRAAAVVSATIAAFSLNFFFIPPYYTLAIASPENIGTFVVFLLMGFLIAQVSSAAQEHAEIAEQQRAKAEQLYSEVQEATERDRSREAEFQAEKIKSAFLDAVTHDLRTPLTSIKAAASSLQHERLQAPDRLAVDRIREYLEVIIEESDRLNRFIENIIALAKRRHGDSLQTQLTSVSELVEAAVERAAGRLRDRRLEVEIPADMPAIAADREAIVEVLYTLLDNAAKYSSTYSRVDVRVRRVENELHITVEDEGSGIAPEMRSRVFEKFARGSDQTHGFGMGLSIAKTIIDAHHGRIWIEGRRSGRGVEVTFSLPLQPASVRAGAAE